MHRERSGISAGPRRCPIGPPAAVLQQWEHPMPSQRSDLQHSAVVVIDMANDFVYPGGVIADAGGPVVYATDAHTPGDSELRKWPPHAMAGSWNAEIVPGLVPEPGDIVLGKQTYSPFLNPAFERTLAERGLTRLYITGLHTDCCARHTSGDAFQRGYDLVWVTDGLQAFTDEAHQAGLEYFKTWYATDPARQLRTVDELVGEWTAVTEPALA